MDRRINRVFMSTHYNHLSHMLDKDEDYIELIYKLKDPKDPKKLMYDYEDVNAWLHSTSSRGKSCTRALISDYSTKNATLGDLTEALRQARLYEAANYISQKVCGLRPVEALPGDEDSESLLDFMAMIAAEHGVRLDRPQVPRQQFTNNDLGDITVAIDAVTDFKYDVLSKATNKFDSRKLSEGGAFLGKGGFSKVYYGLLGRNKVEVAIKRLENMDPDRPLNPILIRKQLDAEIDYVAHFRNENLLRILGSSTDGQHLCIVYEFMKNGILYDHLQCKGQLAPLGATRRINIALGIARGLHYLHTAFEHPLVHRDMKSANILLDENFTAKIGDFGFLREGARGDGTSVVYTAVPVRSWGYVPPETVGRREVTAKMDVYCFGVILLELLTGLRPFGNFGEHGETSLVAYVTDEDLQCADVLDRKAAGFWIEQACEQKPSEATAQALWEVTWKCLAEKPMQRAEMRDVVPMLERLC